ncbi:DUF2200 domain-containing protein [Pseudolysinimonas sp.]|jgi:hypothetical protein|uniref:DUF2200 domain-containing protein n=1 Tax=Pseudolysinimonas sp. TaxID=2680009 RepID=UPI00378378E0
MSRIFTMPFAKVYPLYLTKVERKGRDQAQLDTVIRWLLQIDDETLAKHLENETTFEQLFDEVQLNPSAEKITGMICGMRVEQIEDPLMQKIRYLDKVVDELAQGKAMEKILRA